MQPQPFLGFLAQKRPHMTGDGKPSGVIGIKHNGPLREFVGALHGMRHIGFPTLADQKADTNAPARNGRLR